MHVSIWIREFYAIWIINSDFGHLDLDMASNEDDILYESNVTNGIKSIMVVGEAEDDNISDDLECPFSKELLLGCSLDEEC